MWKPLTALITGDISVEGGMAAESAASLLTYLLG